MALNDKQSILLASLVGSIAASIIGVNIFSNMANNSPGSTGTGTLYTNPLTAKLAPSDQAAILQGSQTLGVPVDWLSAAIFDESGFYPNIQSGKSPGDPFDANLATGAIQFEPGTAVGLGTTVQALYNMTLAQQMPYVVKYFQEVPGSLADYGSFYLKLLSPKLASQNLPNTTVAPADTVEGNAALFTPDNTLGSFKNTVTSRATQNGFQV